MDELEDLVKELRTLFRLHGHSCCNVAAAALERAYALPRPLHEHKCMSCGESWYCPHPASDCKAGESVFPSLTLRGPNGPTIFYHACQGKKP